MRVSGQHLQSFVRVAPTIIFLLLSPAVVRSQVASSQTLDQNRSNSEWKLQAHTADEIAQTNPSMSADLLKQDGVAIQAAYPKLKMAFEKQGFASSQVDQIIAYAWKDFRNDHPSGKLDSVRFAKYTEENFGGLHISSQPTGAIVYVDDKKWDETTNCNGLTHAGKRKITLIKEGYDEVTDYVQVNAGAWSSFTKTLKKK